MAGLFAPELGGINSAARDTIIPDSPLNVATNLVNTATSFLGSRGGAEKENKDERDNRILRPIAEEYQRLSDLRSNGGISETAFKAELNQKTSSFLVEHPELRNDILDLGGDITKVELGVRDVNAIDEISNVINESFKTDPILTSQLNTILLASRDPKTGEINAEVAQQMMNRAFFENQARAASIALNNQELEALEKQNKLKDARALQILDDVTADQSKRAREHVSGLWGSVALTGNTSVDAVTAKTELLKLKAQAAAQFEAEARAGGLFRLEGYSLEKILRPYDDALVVIDATIQEPEKLNEILRAQNSVKVIESLNKFGLPATPETLEMFGQWIAHNKVGTMGRVVDDLTTTLQGRSVQLDTPESPEVFTLEGDINAEAVSAAKSMTPEMKKAKVNSVNKMIEIYGASTDVNNQEQRVMIAKEFGKAIAVMMSEDKIMGGTTFDATYNDKFISAYSKITAADTDESRAFQNNVATHLSSTILGVKNRIDQTIQNEFSEFFSGSKVDGENGKFKVTLGEASSPRGEQILLALKEKGLEATTAGVRELLKDRTFNVGTNPAASTAKEIAGLVVKDLEYVNRVAAFASRLPGQEPIIPASFTTNPDPASTPPEDKRISQEDSEVLVKDVLNFIGSKEAPRGYVDYFRGVTVKPPKLLTEMTINEVLDWQVEANPPGPGTAAAGKYQIINKTLKDLVDKAGLTGEELFNEETQDRLAMILLKRRGLDKFLAGSITQEQFANNLAKEWASLPVVSGAKKGKSFFDGDGINNAQASVEEVLGLLEL